MTPSSRLRLRLAKVGIAQPIQTRGLGLSFPVDALVSVALERRYGAWRAIARLHGLPPKPEIKRKLSLKGRSQRTENICEGWRRAPRLSDDSAFASVGLSGSLDKKWARSKDKRRPDWGGVRRQAKTA
jgi:hypothetical protein